MPVTRPLLFLLLGGLLAACSTPRTGAEVNSVLESAYSSFETRIQQDQPLEAYFLYQSIKAVDPAFRDLEVQAESFRQHHTDLVDYFERDWMGSNFGLREPTDSGIGTRILWYIPDRILDIFDQESLSIHFGVGAHVDVHVTRFVQAKAGAHAVSGIGWHEHRSLGIKQQAEAGFALLAFGAQAGSATQYGTSGVQTGSLTVAGIYGPSDEPYRDFSDFWAVGFSFTAGIVGISYDWHPVQAFDNLVGWFFFDPCNDDFGRTRGNRLSDHEQNQIQHLGDISRDDEELAAYQAFKASGKG